MIDPMQGHTSLHVAKISSSHRAAFDKGGRPQQEGGEPRANNASAKGHFDVALSLLNHGADVNALDKSKCTPLWFAAQENRLNLLDLLLLHGADPKLAEIEGQTPLHCASNRGYLDVANCLLAGGADVNQEDVRGLGALWAALSSGNKDLAALLISHGARVNEMNKRGVTLLEAAAQGGCLDITKLLVKKGAKVDSRSGASAIELATRSGYKEVVDFLSERRASIKARGTNVKSCHCCGVEDVPLKLCAGCSIVWYCSLECQRKDWKEGGENKHKIQCLNNKEQRDESKEKTKEEAEAIVREANQKREDLVAYNEANPENRAISKAMQSLMAKVTRELNSMASSLNVDDPIRKVHEEMLGSGGIDLTKSIFSDYNMGLVRGEGDSRSIGSHGATSSNKKSG